MSACACAYTVNNKEYAGNEWLLGEHHAHPDSCVSPDPDEDMEAEERCLLPGAVGSMPGWKPGCLRACLVRWSLLMKHLSHSGQVKRFSPVCVRTWRVSSSDRENFFTQSGHVHRNGLSPVHQRGRGRGKTREREGNKHQFLLH